MTVVFCDVTGSTALGERLDPEALRALLARYFERMRSIVERHGGTVEKFIGDAVMAVFGVPVVHEDDALRAARAAVEMRDALPELGVTGRIGVTTGEVVTGTEERLATGDPVNVAARLQQAAGPGEVLVAATTLALIRDAVEVEAAGDVELKGKSKPITAHRLLTVLGEAGLTRRSETPLVGRSRESRLLADAWERTVSERSCHLVTILGPAGVGKSRLVAEFLGSTEGTRVVQGRCLPYGEGITYWPIVEVVRGLADVEPGERAAAALRSLIYEDEVPASVDEIAWAFRKLLEAAAAEAPVAAVFDDLNWGEETFLDLVEHIADLSRDAPILLLCMARPDLLDRRPAWGGGKVNATTLLLEPLSDEESDALISELLDDPLLDSQFHARIRDAAEGNPLFVQQMVALLEASPTAEAVVPPTIQALLAARLDQLEPAEREVLQCGSVEGRVFHSGGVLALVGGELRVEACLTTLVRKEFVRPDRSQLEGEDAFRFRHLLIRDAAYNALAKSARADLHRRFAFWLGENSAALLELDELIGYHLEQACRYRAELDLPTDGQIAARARDHLAAAGRRAFMRSDYSVAVSLFERALLLVPAGEIDKALEVDFQVSTFFSGQPAEATRRAGEAVRRAVGAGDRIAELCARIEEEVLGFYVVPEGASARLTAVLDEAMPLFEAAADDFALVVALEATAAVAAIQARFDDARVSLESAIVHARRTGLPHVEASWLLPRLLEAHFHGSTPAADVLALLDESEQRGFRYLGIRRIRVRVLGMVGRIDEGRALLQDILSESEERGSALDVADTSGFTGAEFELRAGDPEAAAVHGFRGCALYEEAGERSWLSTAATTLAAALYELGRLDEAETWAGRAAELGATDDAATQLLWRAVKARLLARRGSHVEAERLARAAIAIAAGTDMVDGQAAAYTCLADVLELAGDRTGADAALREALTRYERKGIEVSAQGIRERLASEA